MSNWFYGELFYTDLGWKNECEKYAGENGGSYVQISLNITNFPINFPISVCLPQECDDVKYFDNLFKIITSKVNKFILIL